MSTPTSTPALSTPVPSKRLPHSAVVVLLVVVATVTAGCVEPSLVEADEAVAAELPELGEDLSVDPGPAREQISALSDLLNQIDEVLATAQEAGDAASARAAGAAALDLMVTRDDSTESALLPHVSEDRATTSDNPAVMVTALSAAGETGGSVGTDLRAIVADSLAGDLGAWQRDAAGMVAWAREVADPRLPLDTLEANVLELPGEGLRALTWTLLLVDATDVDQAQAYALRARAHVGLLSGALDSINVSGTDRAQPGS